MTIKGAPNRPVPEPYRTFIIELIRALVIVVKAARRLVGIPDKPV